MIEMKAIKGSTNSVSQGLFRKGSIRLDNSAFTMCPLRFNRVEPGAFDWQETNQNANTFSCPFDSTVMCSYPGTQSIACVPTGVVPNHCQNRLVQFLDFLAAPLQKLNSDATHGSSISETQKHFLKVQSIACHPPQKNVIAGQAFGSGSSSCLVCSTNRTGCRSSHQVDKFGWEKRLHQVSS